MTIKEVLKLTDMDVLRQEIQDRVNQKSMMVGTLYPSIIDSEIEKIHDRIREIETGQPAKKMKPGSPQWIEAARSLAFSFCPPIHPCKKCGTPVVKGYQCGCGGSADEDYEPYSS